MPKLKTKSGAKKRFGRTGTGKIWHNYAYKRHRLISKPKQGKRKRRGKRGPARPDAARLRCRLRRFLRCRRALAQQIGAHRFGDVLEALRPEVRHLKLEPRLDLPVGVFRQTNPARLANPLEPGRDVDAIAHEVAVRFLDNIAEVRKGFGLIASMAGVFVGGVAIARFGVMRPLVVGAFALPITNTIFGWLAVQGPQMPALMLQFEQLRRRLAELTQHALATLAEEELSASASQRVRSGLFARWSSRRVEARVAAVAQSWEPAQIAACERRASQTDDELERTVYRTLARLMLALFNRHGGAWGARALIGSLATDLACNELGGEAIGAALEMFPSFSRLRLLRHWAGRVDITPDTSPIMGPTPVEGLYINCGWGTGGFKAIPVGGWTLAHALATGANHPLAEPFQLERFVTGRLIDEAAASGIAH